MRRVKVLQTEYDLAGAIRNHPEGPSEDDDPGISARLADRFDTEFMIEPLERPENSRHSLATMTMG